MSTPTIPKGGGGAGFSKSISGVPLWGWAAITVTVVGGMLYIKRSGPKTPAMTAIPQGIGYATVGNLPQTTTSDVVRINDNNAWRIAAMNDLVQKGYDPTLADAALSNYLSGNTLDRGQRPLLDIALRDIGPLPESLAATGIPLIDVSPLHTPAGGNFFGQLAQGFGSLLGLDDPSNPFAAWVDPFLNNVIDQGPLSGLFANAQQLIGGNLSLSGNAANVNIPGIGTIGLGGQLSGQGISLTGNLPGAGNIGFGVSPNYTQRTLGTYVIQPGDTLAAISTKLYGSSGGAQSIYSSNLTKIPDPSRLIPGSVLTIPAPGSNA